MRNAFGLMLASVVSAVVIAAVWFWTSSPRADAAAPPQTVNARKAEPLAAAAARPVAPREDVEVTASLSAPVPAKPAAPVQAKCANADRSPISGLRIEIRDQVCGRRESSPVSGIRYPAQRSS